MRKRYYHAATPEIMRKIVADGAIKRGWDGYVYICEKPEDAVKFVAIRHTIQVFDGCAEEIAEYKCKEDCLLVLYAIFKAIEQGGKTAELPTQEEMKEQREALKQYLESGKKLTEWTAELLKELLDM